MTTTSPSTADPRRLHQVRSLLAKAESTTFAEEAAALTAKAHEIMAAHAIDRALLEAAEPDRQRIVTRRVVVPAPYARPKFSLLSGVARASQCRAILGFDGVDDGDLAVLRNGDQLATVVGHETDVETVDVLFTSLLVQAVNVMLAHGTVVTEWGENRTRSFRHSFLYGFASTVEERLRASGAKATEEGDVRSNGRLSPVLADRRAAVDRTVAETFPDLETLTATISNPAGLSAGSRAGNRADIGNPRMAPTPRTLPGG